MQLSIVCALAKNGVIGQNNRLPWHLPKELAYFKQLTQGKAVLMGRRTFESIGKPLVNRRNIVLSTQPELVVSGCEVYPSFDEALTAMAHEAELMVIGGATLFEQALPMADRLYLTWVDCDVAGDIYFPAWEPRDWRLVSQQDFAADVKNLYAFSAILYERLK